MKHSEKYQSSAHKGGALLRYVWSGLHAAELTMILDRMGFSRLVFESGVTYRYPNPKTGSNNTKMGHWRAKTYNVEPFVSHCFALLGGTFLTLESKNVIKGSRFSLFITNFCFF